MTVDPNHDNPPPNTGDAHVSLEKSKVIICEEFQKIIQTMESVEKGLESLAELNKRKEINEHLKSCNKYSCYLERVDRINKGLY